MLPIAISTVANTLTILDITIKFAKLISPKSTTSLIETRDEVARMKSNRPANVAEKVLLDRLRKNIPPDDLQETANHLAMLMELLVPLILEIDDSKSKTKLPRYSVVISRMLPIISNGLYNWGCFHSWGKILPEVKGEEESILKLEAKNTTLVFNNLPQYNHLISEVMPGSKIYFPYNAHYESSMLATDGDYYKVKTSLIYSQYNTYQYWYRHITLRFGEPRSRVELDISIDVNNKVMELVGKEGIQFSIPEYEQIIFGLLSDFSDYSKLVRGGVAKLDSFVENLAKFIDANK